MNRVAGLRAQSLRQDQCDKALPTSIVIELIAGSLASGTSISSALLTVGEAMGDQDGRALIRVAMLLQLGAGWFDAWVGCPRRFEPLRDAMVHSWEFGAPVTQGLRGARQSSEAEALVKAKEAAEQLGVKLALPLGLCFLPSFVVLAVVPIVAMFAQGLF